ncbi:MAG TPA: hypothetical protein VJY33_14265, partial [Isosphaeraceae bacterium]|nr:hypothetical protein [Isosphaeraceae bacterium]
MNSRALRNHRLRNRAWALVAALLPATECWATDGQDVPATNPDTSAATSAASSPGTTDARSTRFRIPPPRRFTPEEIQARLSSPRQAGPKIPPPRQSVTAPEAQQPLFAPVPAQHQEAVSLFRPASEVPGQLQDVPKPGPTTGGASASADVSAPLLRPTSDPVTTSTAAEPKAASGDLSQSLQGSGRTLKPEPTPAPESVAEPGSDRAAVAVAPPAREEPPAQGLAEPEGQGKDSPKLELSIDKASAAALSQALQTLDATPRNSQAETAAAAPQSPAQVEASQAGTGQPKADPAGEPKSNPDQRVSQAVKSAQSTARAPGQAPAQSQDHQVERTACATCGGFHSSLEGGVFHASMGCANGNCIPGRPPCNPPCNECNTVIDALCQNLYQCLCCPDPCYQPTWEPAANASFFADYARPRTVTRIRYDNLEAMTRPDRNQFWIHQVTLLRSNPNRTFTNPTARLQQVSLYQEAAGERGSFFVEYPYRQINSNWEPTQAGFGDVNFGVKSLLFDCEMLQITFQMRTYMPSGNFTNNLGTGQFVVDPSILTSLKLSPTTYCQGQFGNWVPVGGPGGNSKLAGGIFYWLMSVNQVLCYATPDSPLIATLEMDGWSFENGDYTHFIPPNKTSASGFGGGLVEKGGGVSYFNIGPGLRQSVCNRLDFGG